VTSILLVEDESALSEPLSYLLEREGYDVTVAEDGLRAVTAFDEGDYDLILLDLMLPGMPGTEVCREIRTRSQIPIIMVTAKDSEVDIVVGLELGADDYVTKPCTPRELTARVRAILRRTHDTQPNANAGVVLSVGKLSVMPEQRRATWDGANLELTSTEFNLLEVLARHAGRPVSKNELSEQGLGRPLARFDRNIDVHLSSLRHKLGLLDDGRSPLQTVYRLGYQLLRM